MAERRVRRTPRAQPVEEQRPKKPPRDVAMAIAEETIKAKADLEKVGLFLAPRPGDGSPELPEDPTALNDSDLMKVFGRFTAWADYLAGQLALAEVDERTLHALAEKQESLVMLRHRPTTEQLRKGEVTMTLIKAEVAQNMDVIERWQEHATVYARRKLLNTMFERADRDAAYLSRELTRRTGGQDPKQRRASRWMT